MGGPCGLTRVGFLGRLFPFALGRTAGRLVVAPFDPLAVPRFLLLVLLGCRLLAGWWELLGPRLRPQRRFWPLLISPKGGHEAQAAPRHTAQVAASWPLRPAACCLAGDMSWRQLV